MSVNVPELPYKWQSLEIRSFNKFLWNSGPNIMFRLRGCDGEWDRHSEECPALALAGIPQERSAATEPPVLDREAREGCSK